MSERIGIKPETFDTPQRIEASEIATALGKGLRMEVHSGHTEYHADATVAVGSVAVYASQRYKEWPTYETTLASPEDPWLPFAYRRSGFEEVSDE